MAETPARSLVGEYLSVLLRRWWWIIATVAFSGGYDVVKYVAESLGYALVLPRWLGFALGAFALFIAQFVAFADMRKQRDGARAAVATKRPRVAPELIYTPFGNVGQERVILHVTNVGEWPLRELAIQPIGAEGYSRATFDLVQLLKGGGERTEIRVRFSGDSHPRSIHDVLGHVFMVKFVAAQRRGELLTKHTTHIPLAVSYRDVHTGEQYSEEFCFDFIEPSTNIPMDGRWVIRSHTGDEPSMPAAAPSGGGKSSP